MIDKQLLNQTVTEKLSGTEYFLVELKITPDNQISVDIDTPEGVDLDFCVALHRHIESVFDRDVEDYSLEVGSAGVTSQFKVLPQYLMHIGDEVEVLSKDGRKISGILTEANEQEFVVAIEKLVKPEGAKRKIKVIENTVFSYDQIKYTKYIISVK